MIRKFQSTDTGQVMNIWLRGNEDAHSFIPKDYWKSNYSMVQEQLLQAEVYVHETEGTIQGFVGIQENYLAGIFVKKEVRSTGIGKQLLDYVKAIHPVLTLNVYQRNRRAVEFYKREGFSITLEDIDPDTGEADYTMRWYHNKDMEDFKLLFS